VDGIQQALTAREMIAVRRLSKRFGNADAPVVALSDIEFSIGEGELVVVVGPSGCGKSTLLRILAGLLPQSDGEAFLHGTPITGPRRDIGVVFQSPVLFPWRSVLGNALLPVDVQRLGRDKLRARAMDLLKLVGLQGFEHRYPWELSGGMQQRVGICRALIHDPDILLMDEPFSALDALTREELSLELMRLASAAKGESGAKTVLFVTHSVPEAVLLADRVLVMAPRPGRIVDDIEIRLPRPRSFDQESTPEFHEYAKRIRGHIFGSRAKEIAHAA
jgi:NitT/TauT family transport system ATP-binding protein